MNVQVKESGGVSCEFADDGPHFSNSIIESLPYQESVEKFSSSLFAHLGHFPPLLLSISHDPRA